MIQKHHLSILSLLFCGLLFFSCLGQKKSTAVRTDAIDWVSFEDLSKISKKKPKKVMIDVYTDWCGWCKKMDASTFQDPKIIEYLNKNYYSVKLNGENKTAIRFKDKDYNFVANGRRGYNELAAELLNGKMSYPSIIFLDEELESIQSIPGYKDVPTLDMILNYFGGDHHKDTPWADFAKSYSAAQE